MIKLNNHLVTPTIFPDRSSQVWKLPEDLIRKTEQNVVTWDFEEEAEFLWVAQLFTLIFSVKPEYKTVLELPYFPYARQDKPIGNNATFAKTTFVALLNSLPGLSKVRVIDIHSSDHDGYFIVNQSPLPFIKQAIRKVGPSLIVFPDKGAETRYGKMLEALPTVTCDKVRDCGTGDIVGMTIDRSLLKYEDRVLMVDDLCDGGRTFIEVAKLLRQAGISDISLYTTHGIYSKGTGVLLDAGILRIFNRTGEVI